MVQTQFFKRSDLNINTYKDTFKSALKRCETVQLFPKEVITFLYGWIETQTSYIPREDIDNFWVHLDHIYSNKNFYTFIQQQLTQVQKGEKIIEYSFNLISQLHESAQKFESSEKKRTFNEQLEMDKKQSKKEDEAEMEAILRSL